MPDPPGIADCPGIADSPGVAEASGPPEGVAELGAGVAEVGAKAVQAGAPAAPLHAARPIVSTAVAMIFMDGAGIGNYLGDVGF